MQHTLGIKPGRIIHAVRWQVQRIIAVTGIDHIVAASPLNKIIASTGIDDVIPAGSGHPVNAACPRATSHNVHRCERNVHVTHTPNLPGMGLGIMANNKICRYFNKKFTTGIRIKPIRISICICSRHGNNQMRTIQHKLADIKSHRTQITIRTCCRNRELTGGSKLR